MPTDTRERFFAVPGQRRVVRHTYRICHEWASWMAGQATPEDMPVCVLSCMEDYQGCANNETATALAISLNGRANDRGTLQTGKVVVP